MAKPYKKPDLKAPRYRPNKLTLSNQAFYNEFISENPCYANQITLEKFKEIIKIFNGLIWQTVIEERDGVELPEQLGYIFIGTCPRKKSNVDFYKSQLYGQVIQNQNWESDHYLAKIFYTNFETKYSFRNHEMWSFAPLRDFKRTVARTYPKEWKKYVVVDNMVRVSRIFRKQSYKQMKVTETVDLLKTYDEFNLD